MNSKSAICKTILSFVALTAIGYADNTQNLNTSNQTIPANKESNELSEKELFVLGMNAKMAGKLSESEKYFKELLLKDPNALRVKLELAEVSFALGKKETAKTLLNEVKVTNPPAKVGENIDSFLAFIAKNEPKEWSGYIKAGVTYDSNANQGPNIDTVLMYDLPFTLSEDAKGNSDWAMIFGAGVRHNKIINDKTVWQSGLYYSMTNYRDINSYDAQSLSFSTGPSWKNGAWTFSAPYIANAVKIGHTDRYYSVSNGIAPQFLYQVNQLWSIGSSLALQHKHYYNAGDRDSDSITFSPTARRMLTDRSYVNFGGYIGRESSGIDTMSNSSKGINAGYVNAITPLSTLYANVSYGDTEYDGVQAAFEEARDDKYSSLALGWSYEIPKWASSLDLSFNYGKNSSTIDMYDFDRKQVSIELTRNF